jgi:hypothetical protein
MREQRIVRIVVGILQVIIGLRLVQTEFRQLVADGAPLWLYPLSLCMIMLVIAALGEGLPRIYQRLRKWVGRR